MASMDEHILRTAKEITVKFIETGRISPTGFADAFRDIYQAVEQTVKGTAPEPESEPAAEKKK